MTREKITQQLLDEIIVDYKNGMTPKALSKKYKRSAGAIIVKLQSLGVFTPTKYRFTQEDIEYLSDNLIRFYYRNKCDQNRGGACCGRYCKSRF